MKIIIDCDAGIDDAQAIMIALSQEVDVLAITCTCGNVNVDQVTKNVLKVLEACERTDIPVYKGAYRSLLGIAYEQPLYHGFDGLGDATDIKDPDTSLLQQTHAAQALVQLVNENPGEIVIIALGPLTNIALASNFDAEFTKKVKEVFILGGCIRGKGNHWVSAEFNFGADPEAAYILLNQFKCPISLVSWETCLEHPLDWEFFEQYVGAGTKRAEFMRKISTKIKEYEEKMNGEFISCDPFALCAALQPKFVQEETSVHATVELKEGLTRGQMVIDWRQMLQKPVNVRLITKMDLELFKEIMLNSVK